MFRNCFQKDIFSVLYSLGSEPLQLWGERVKNGRICRTLDCDLNSQVIEVYGLNTSSTYITHPKDPKQTLGLRHPFLVMIIKSLKKYFSFEVTIRDSENIVRRLRASNYQSKSVVTIFYANVPLSLGPGWNILYFDLANFTKMVFGTTYRETLRLTIHANIRIRRIYFTRRLYDENELPKEYRLYRPVHPRRDTLQDIKNGILELTPLVPPNSPSKHKDSVCL